MSRLFFCLLSVHHADARGGSQGGSYRRKDGYGEVDDFLPEFFFHSYEFFEL